MEWFERGSDPGRLTFVPGDGVVCFVNSTELRHIVAEGGVFPRPGGKRWEIVNSEPETKQKQNDIQAIHPARS